MERADGTGRMRMRMRMRTRTRIRTGKSHTGRQIGRQTGRQAGAGAGEVQLQRQRQHIDLLNKGGYKPVGSREWLALPHSHALQALHCHETRGHWGDSGHGHAGIVPGCGEWLESARLLHLGRGRCHGSRG
jgi:hypothetical protein